MNVQMGETGFSTKKRGILLPDNSLDKNCLALLSVTYLLCNVRQFPWNQNQIAGPGMLQTTSSFPGQYKFFPPQGFWKGFLEPHWKVAAFSFSFDLSGSICILKVNTALNLLSPCRMYLLKNTLMGYRFTFLNTLNHLAAPSSKWPLESPSYSRCRF